MDLEPEEFQDSPCSVDFGGLEEWGPYFKDHPEQKYEGEDKTVFGKGLEDLYVPYKVACGYEDEPCADYEELLLHDAETVGVGLLGEEGGG